MVKGLWSGESALCRAAAEASQGRIAGGAADFCVLEVTEENVLDELHLYVNGQLRA